MSFLQARREIARAKRERFQRMFAVQIMTVDLPSPIVEHKFAQRLGREWRADFAWPDLKILVEIDGGIWKKGGAGHSHPSGILRDMEKLNDAAKLGYRVFRFSTDQVLNGHAIKFMSEIL